MHDAMAVLLKPRTFLNRLGHAVEERAVIVGRPLKDSDRTGVRTAMLSTPDRIPHNRCSG